MPGVTETNLNGKGHGERRGPIERVGVDQPADVAKVAVLCSGPTGKEALPSLGTDEMIAGTAEVYNIMSGAFNENLASF